MDTAILFLTESQVEAGLGMDACMERVRTAMIALSAGRTRQLPRTLISVGEAKTFGLMPGALGLDDYFGAKIVSVFGDPKRPGRTAHQGVVALFEGDRGAPVCVADAGAITRIRTAAATAVATDALARRDASTLTLLGHGHQAGAHIDALLRVRPLQRIVVWGRSPERAEAFADEMGRRVGVTVVAEPSAQAAVEQADIVCTLTPSREPIVKGAWLKPGMHVNLVGSSGPVTVEADDAVVARSRYFVESRENAGLAAAEYIRARQSGAIGEGHIAAEIGEVLAGDVPGRTTDEEITVYKSLGHTVQDLAACAYLYEQARA